MRVCAHGCIHLFGAGAQAVHMLYRLHWGLGTQSVYTNTGITTMLLLHDHSLFIKTVVNTISWLANVHLTNLTTKLHLQVN